jgi:hypothetical protein
LDIDNVAVGGKRERERETHTAIDGAMTVLPDAQKTDFFVALFVAF